MIEQTMPYSAEYEQLVLGCLMQDKTDYCIKLVGKDFHLKTNQHIFQIILKMYDGKKPVDFVTVADALEGTIENSISFTSEIINKVPTTENIGYYIQELKDLSLRRAYITAAREAEAAAFTGELNGINLKSEVLGKFDINVYVGGRQNNSIVSVMERVLTDMEKQFREAIDDRYYTKFYDLDKLTAGLHPEELTIIAARPGVGKTAFALQLMIRLATKGVKSLLVSREMSAEQIAKRMIANVACIDGHKMRLCKNLTEDDWEKIGKVSTQIMNLPVEINSELSTIQEIKSYCRELKVKDSLDLLIVDYIGLLKTSKRCESRRLEIDDISRTLKEMSLELKIPVITLAQLNRDVKNAGEPELHHLKESGGIEQDADNVIFLHVPKDTDEFAEWFDISVIVAKQRNGPTGRIKLRYYKKTFKFESLGYR